MCKKQNVKIEQNALVVIALITKDKSFQGPLTENCPTYTKNFQVESFFLTCACLTTMHLTIVFKNLTKLENTKMLIGSKQTIQDMRYHSDDNM